MKPITDKEFTHMLTNRSYWSDAYQSLAKSAQNLMWCMYAELRWTGTRKKKDFSYTNNGQIGFTETDIKKLELGAFQPYHNAVNQLIRVGIIKKIYSHGMAKRDMKNNAIKLQQDSSKERS